MALSTPTSPVSWRPDQVAAINASDAIPDALITTITTKVGEISGDAPAVRVPATPDDQAAIVPEGSAIAESTPALAEVVLFTQKLGWLTRVTAEQFHQDGTAERLALVAARAIQTTADQFVLTNPAPANGAVGVTGLLNIPGIVAGAQINGNLDPLVDLLAQLATNRARPSHIVLAPTAWAALRKIKTATTSNQALLGAGVSDAAQQLLDVPVIINPAMPTLTGLVIDDTDAISAYSDVEVAQSADIYFASDSIALRTTFRLGATLIHPNRHGTFTVKAA